MFWIIIILLFIIAIIISRWQKPRIEGGFSCHNVPIAPGYALTAAHCMLGEAHPEYNLGTPWKDIALIADPSISPVDQPKILINPKDLPETILSANGETFEKYKIICEHSDEEHPLCISGSLSKYMSFGPPMEPGKSGSGVYFTDSKGQRSLVGIVSELTPEFSHNVKTKITNISPYLDWIESKTGPLQKCRWDAESLLLIDI